MLGSVLYLSQAICNFTQVGHMTEASLIVMAEGVILSSSKGPRILFSIC